MRFVRLASRYEEEVIGSTKIGYSSSSFTEAPASRTAQLGSGIAFNDEATCMRELTANAPRIEAWRKTNAYQYCIIVRLSFISAVYRTSHLHRLKDFAKHRATSAIKGDVLHQLFRMRHARVMTDAEATAIMRFLAENVKSYEQVVEVCLNQSLIAHH